MGAYIMICRDKRIAEKKMTGELWFPVLTLKTLHEFI
jgi:hypothetical protein